MKMTQLLTGAAAIALVAGAASAQTVTINTATSDFDGDNIVASEFEGALAGNLILALDFNGAFASLGANGEVDMIVTLTNADFSGIVTANPDFVDDSCDFAIQSGGGAGGVSVTFRNAATDLYTCTNGAGTDAQATLSLPIEVSTIGESVDVSIQFVRNSGSAGYTGGTTAFDLIDYVEATGYTFTSNANTTDLLVTGGTLIDWSAGAAAGNPGLLGTFSADDLTDTDAGSAGIQAPTVDVAGTPLASYDTVVGNNNELVFTFEDVTNITGITTTAGSCAGPDTVANTITCELDGAEVNTSNTTPVSYTLTISNSAEVVAPQTIGVTFTPEAESSFSEDGAADANFAVLDEDDGVFTAEIYANGVDPVTGSPFVWTSLRQAGGTKSAFRMTGLNAEPTEIAVVVDQTYARSGATAPAAARAVIAADVQEDPLNAGQYTATFTSEDIATALGSDGGVNGDVHFEVVLADNTDKTTIAVNRLLSTSGAVSGTGFDN